MIAWNQAKTKHLILFWQCIVKISPIIHISLPIDPRTKTWFLSNTPGPLLSILATYLYFCLYAGPRYMKNRKPFQLKNTLIIYNISQVVFSIILVIEVSTRYGFMSKIGNGRFFGRKCAIDNTLCNHVPKYTGHTNYKMSKSIVFNH